MNVRLAQLGWPVLAEVEAGPRDAERLVLRLYSADGGGATDHSPFRVEADSLARPNLIDSILAELRARGWDGTQAGTLPRADVPWCAPA
jgi:hypothetical protein